MSEPALATPVERPWVLDDLARLPADGRRYEILEGSLLVSPPPLVGHQRIAGRLRELLDQAAPPECETLEAVGVQVGSSVLIPDVVVARVQSPHTAVLAPPDVLLVVDVVSPSSVTTDRASKPVLYADGGIPAFWRVESAGGTVTVFAHRLEGSGYVEDIVVHSG